MQLGEEVGRGVRSVVYAFGERDVAKLPNDDVPSAWLVEELRLADIAARAGAPVPGRRRLTEIAGRRVLVLERIDGPSLWDVFATSPERAAEIGVRLARVQADLARHATSFELPAQRDRIISKIHLAARDHGADLLGVLDVLPPDSGPLVFCHGDLHPRNVLVATTGEVLVDWFDASRGVLAGEIARTMVMLQDTSELGVTWNEQLASATVELRASYESEALALADVSREQLAAWCLVQSVARLSEGFGVSRVDDLRDRLDEARAGRLAACHGG